MGKVMEGPSLFVDSPNAYRESEGNGFMVVTYSVTCLSGPVEVIQGICFMVGTRIINFGGLV